MIQKLKTCRFKIDMKNFANFDPSTRKSKKFVLIGSLLAKYILFELKNIEELSFMTLKNDTKIEEELTCRFKIDKNFTNFDWSTRKSKKFVF